MIGGCTTVWYNIITKDTKEKSCGTFIKKGQIKKNTKKKLEKLNTLPIGPRQHERTADCFGGSVLIFIFNYKFQSP